MSKTFLDIVQGQQAVGDGLRDASDVFALGTATGLRAGDTHLMAAQAFVLVRKRFFLQDDLTRTGGAVLTLSKDVLADTVALQAAVVEFTLACGADWVQDNVLDPAQVLWSYFVVGLDVTTDYAQYLFDENPPRLREPQSTADVVKVERAVIDLEAYVTFGGAGKIEVTKEYLQDGTVRVTVTGEAAALAALGIGARSGEDGLQASVDGRVGAFSSATWDLASDDDANKLLAHLTAVAVIGGAVAPVAGYPAAGVTAGYLAGGTKRLRVPEPHSVESGIFGEGNLDVSGGLGPVGAGLVGALRVTESVVVRTKDGSFTAKAKVECKVSGEFQLPNGKIVSSTTGGTLSVSGTLESTGGRYSAAELRITTSTSGGASVEVGAANPITGSLDQAVRTEVVVRLDEAALKTPEGQRLADAVKRGDMATVRDLLPRFSAGLVTTETWADSSIKGGANIDGAYGVKVKGDLGVEGTRSRRL